MRKKKTSAKKTPRKPSARRIFFINFVEVFLLILVALFFCRPEWLQHDVEQTVGSLFSLGAARGFKIAMLYGFKALYITIYTIFVHYLFVFLGNFDLRLTMKSDFRIGAGVLLVAFFILVNSIN